MEAAAAEAHVIATPMISIAREAVLRFYDEHSATNGFHSNAVNAVLGEDLALGLLVHYLRSQGSRAQVLGTSVTTGRQKGPRLDAWVESVTEAADTLFQVEVKNWNAHSLGGRPLPLSASTDQSREYLAARWREEWNEESRTFHSPAINKVLTPMVTPRHAPLVMPLLAIWIAMHPHGKLEPYFEVEANGPFPKVAVFSVSTYLRTLSAETIAIEAPRAQERLSILSGLVPVVQAR